jgi:uncharacterized membrane protein
MHDRAVMRRLDAFVDAAFAFAVTLLVIGGGAVPQSFADLRASAASAPAFAVGFALIAMFWHAHVRWRAYGTRGGALPLLLSLLLVFLVLLYVYPLRLMAASLVAYFGGPRTPAAPLTLDDAQGLFAMYGIGFFAMAACVAAMFATARARSRPPGEQAELTGQAVIWAILAASGLLSALIAAVAPALAPWTYCLLPIAIGLFSWRHDWSGTRGAPQVEGASTPAG